MNGTELVLLMSLTCQSLSSFGTINYKRTPNEATSITYLDVSIYVGCDAAPSGKYLPSVLMIIASGPFQLLAVDREKLPRRIALSPKQGQKPNCRMPSSLLQEFHSSGLCLTFTITYKYYSYKKHLLRNTEFYSFHMTERGVLAYMQLERVKLR